MVRRTLSIFHLLCRVVHRISLAAITTTNTAAVIIPRLNWQSTWRNSWLIFQQLIKTRNKKRVERRRKKYQIKDRHIFSKRLIELDWEFDQAGIIRLGF